MSGTTITQSSTVGVTLSAADANPLAIQTGVQVSVSGQAAVYSDVRYYWTIVNAGTLISAGTASDADGIELTRPSSATIPYGGGTVTNVAKGLIKGSQVGVSMTGAGSLVNQGTIVSTYTPHTAVVNGSVVSYAGYTYSQIFGWQPEAGAVVMGGGVVRNTKSGLISSTVEALAIGPNGTVFNAGRIDATSADYGFGVVLTRGGALQNLASGTVDAGESGVLGFGYGVEVNNHGLIEGRTGLGVGLNEGGSVDNVAGATIIGGHVGIEAATSYVYIDNAGLVQGETAAGILMQDGGTITNEAQGVIIGKTAGIYAAAYAACVVNAGSIGSAGDGIALLAGGYVSNASSGRISGATNGIYVALQSGADVAGVYNEGLVEGESRAGVLLGGAGYVINTAGGRITGGYEGVFAGGSAASTVLNTGVLEGSAFAGMYLTSGGVVSNASGGVIDSSAGEYGVNISNAPGTVLNAGTIGAAALAGVYLGSGGKVTNQPGGAIGGVRYGVEFGTIAGTVLNAGLLTGAAGAGVYLERGGSVTNVAGATISGGLYGVKVEGASGTIINAGSILSAEPPLMTGFPSAGVLDTAGEYILNQAGGVIASTWIGVQIGSGATAAPGTVVNHGLMIANHPAGAIGQASSVDAGVWIKGPGAVTNAANGTISGGPYDILGYAQVTVVNQGSLYGSEYAFKAMQAGFADRLIESPGAAYSGMLDGGNTLGSAVHSTLELASGSSAGTIASLSNVVDFGVITLDAGATWSIGGSIQALETISFGGADASLILSDPTSPDRGVISGFAPTDTLVLAGLMHTTGLSLSSSGLLTVFESGVAGPTFQFASPPALTFSVVDGSTDITCACFVEGTRLATPDGACPVERLRAGMTVRSGFGGVRKVVWVGRRTIDCARHTRPARVWPVEISAGAFGQGLPAVALRLSPDHAVLVNGALVPVGLLVNGRSIRQVAVRSVTYFHVELPRHDVVLAEDLPVESYLDVGDRGNFEGSAVLRLFPEFGVPGMGVAETWEAYGCAPLVIHGPALAAARAVVDGLVQAVA